MGERRLADIQRLLQAASTAFARVQQCENGETILIAHRFESHFGSISSLPIGTTVNFTDMNGNTFRFRTVSIETLNTDQTEELLSDEYAMTLMTCTLSSAQRIVVRCERR